MKYFALIILFISLHISAFSQGEQQVAQADEITYVGLDFTQAVVIGESVTGEELVNKFFRAWNNVVYSEESKYDFAKTFKKKNVKRDISYISKINDQRDPEDVVAYENQTITEDELVQHINSYEIEGSGVGLVFVVENFNKLEEEGTMWVTFFDMDTKKVLMAKHMSGDAGGFGMKNFWARTVYNVLNNSKKKYKKWIK